MYLYIVRDTSNYNLNRVLYSKTRSFNTIGANNDHPYKPAHNQLEMILTHIEAAFWFNS